MKRYKLTISYDGTHYAGWQVQPIGVSIQSLIQKALITLLREPVDLTGASRTDAGVHALGQVAHFSTIQLLDFWKFRYSLNALLPKDIRIIEIEEVSPSFHARYSAKGKIYRYCIHLGHVHDPFFHSYSLHIPHILDIEKIKQAAFFFVGTHDFTSFANDATLGSAAKNPVKTIKRLEVILKDSSQLHLEFEGDGFLYKMIRNIVGTLLEVGKGKFSIDEIPAIFHAKNRRKAFGTVSPRGLFLIKVLYCSLATE